jgi:hypothetical protein
MRPSRAAICRSSTSSTCLLTALPSGCGPAGVIAAWGIGRNGQKVESLTATHSELRNVQLNNFGLGRLRVCGPFLRIQVPT